MKKAPPQAVERRVDGVHHVVTGEGPHTVVLLHGFTDNLTTWNRVVPALAARHRVIAVDLPGFGRSAPRPGRPLLDGYVETVAEVLDATGVDGPVSIIGNSMGAAVATLFATRFPERVDALVLVDMPGLGRVPALWRLAMSKPAELGLRTALRVVPHELASQGLRTLYGHLAAADPRRLDPTTVDGFAAPYRRAGSVPDLLPLGRALVTELGTAKLAEHVAACVAPVLVLFGARDLLTPARVTRRLSVGGRDGRGGVRVLPGCGHCPQLDRPADLLAEVLPFLDPDGAARVAA